MRIVTTSAASPRLGGQAKWLEKVLAEEQERDKKNPDRNRPSFEAPGFQGGSARRKTRRRRRRERRCSVGSVKSRVLRWDSYSLPHASALQSDAMDHGSGIMDCETGRNLHEKETAATEAVGRYARSLKGVPPAPE